MARKGQGGSSGSTNSMNSALSIGMVFLFTAIGILLIAKFFPPATQLLLGAMDDMQNDNMCTEYHGSSWNTTDLKCYSTEWTVEDADYYALPLVDILDPDNGIVGLIVVALVIALIVTSLFVGFRRKKV